MATKKAAKKPAKKAAKKGAKKAAPKKAAKKAAKKKKRQFGPTGYNNNFPQAHTTQRPYRPFEGTDNASNEAFRSFLFLNDVRELTTETQRHREKGTKSFSIYQSTLDIFHRYVFRWCEIPSRKFKKA